MIIETSANHFYTVWETGQPGLDHVWFGYAMKRVRGEFVLTARALKNIKAGRGIELVRKEASRVVGG